MGLYRDLTSCIIILLPILKMGKLFFKLISPLGIPSYLTRSAADESGCNYNIQLGREHEWCMTWRGKLQLLLYSWELRVYGNDSSNKNTRGVEVVNLAWQQPKKGVRRKLAVHGEREQSA